MKLITKLTKITTAIVLATGITAVSMQSAQAGPRNGGNVAAAIAGAVIHNAIDNRNRRAYRRNYGGGGHAYRRNFGGGGHAYRRNFGGGGHANRRNFGSRFAFRRNFGGGHGYRGFRRGRH